VPYSNFSLDNLRATIVGAGSTSAVSVPKLRQPPDRRKKRTDNNLMFTEAVDNFVDNLESPSAIRPAVLLPSELPFKWAP
jgi:hypothetical protein